MSRFGRPPKAEADRRFRRVTVALTKAEYEALNREAIALDTTISELLRDGLSARRYLIAKANELTDAALERLVNPSS